MAVLKTSGNTAYYIYDAAGQRVRKVVEKAGGIKEERYYLGNYEVYRKFVGITLETERTTAALTDDKRKIATIDKLTVEERSLITLPLAVIRYQFDNHLGSASLELDASAQIISYEEYHPFGTTSYRSGKSETEVSLKRYKYVGKERDEETGLYYYGFRYYAPWIARFINIDPLQHEYPHYTPFQYAGNKPITYVDLDGLEEYRPHIPGTLEGETKREITLVDKGNSVRAIDELYYWHTGSQETHTSLDQHGKTEEFTIGYASGWYTYHEFFNITKDLVRGKTGALAENTQFADGWASIAAAAYIKSYENSDFWINPETNKWEINPHSFKGIHRHDIVFDVAGLVYGFSMMKFGAKSLTKQISSASKIGGEVVETGVEVAAAKSSKSGGEFLFNTWHKGTFPNKTQSVMYHVGKHGNGRTAVQYTQDAMKFFNKNKGLGQNVILKDGTQGIKIQTKQIINSKTHRVGGYWTSDGKLVTFWD